MLGAGVLFPHNNTAFYPVCRSSRVNTFNRTYADSGLEEHFAKCLDRAALMLNRGGPLSTLGTLSKGKSFIFAVLCKHNFKAVLTHGRHQGLVILRRLRLDDVLHTRILIEVA